MSHKRKVSAKPQDELRMKISPRSLSEKEVARMETVWKRIRKRQAENKPEAQDTFELIYLGFLANIKNKEAVEKDLKELKKMLDDAAAKMMAILAKSEGLASKDRLTVEKVNATDAQNILEFLNSSKTAKEIADAIEIPGERDVGVRVARNILEEREKIGKFTNLDQVLSVPQVGPERFKEIIYSLRKRRPL